MSTVPALFRRLVDDAAVFPPGDAPLPRAVHEHGEHLRAEHGPVVGRFLCRASELSELELPAAAVLGVIADRGLDHALAALAAVRLPADVIEYALDPQRPLAPQVRRVTGARAVVEIPLVPGWRGAVRACVDQGLTAKVRTGGLTPDAFPDPHALANFIAACVLDGVPFKCTAGLHRAVRHTECDAGFHAHGFLNVLVATHAAMTDGDVFAAMTARDGGDLAAVCWGIDEAAAMLVRAAFTGFGSCSINEPVADLRALGLLPAARTTVESTA